MGKNDENPFYETGIWNVATGYSFDILMYHIYWIDRYEILAKHGAIDVNQELGLSEYEKKEGKIIGINWFYTHLYSLVSNSKFAVKKKEEREKLDKIQKNLKKFEKYLKEVKKEKINQQTNSVRIEINEKLFELCLENLIKLKEEIFPILYRANIVFQYKENYSPEDIKKMHMKRLTEVG